jgi:hypothetical protein
MGWLYEHINAVFVSLSGIMGPPHKASQIIQTPSQNYFETQDPHIRNTCAQQILHLYEPLL